MDQGTAQVVVAAIAAATSIATVVLQLRVLERTGQVHSLVNGLAHEKAQLLEVAALKEGELRGRDFTPPDATTSSAPPDV